MIFSSNYPCKYENLTKRELIEIYQDAINNLMKTNADADEPLLKIKNGELINSLEYDALDILLKLGCVQEERQLKELRLNPDAPKKDITECLPCRVNYSSTHRALLIDTPVRLGSYRTHKNNVQEWEVVDMCKIALDDYFQKHDCNVCTMIDNPYSISVVRRCLKNQTSSSVPDADNVETRHMINEFVSIFRLVSDSYCDYVHSSCYIEYVDDINDCGTSFLLVSEKNRPEFESTFIKNNRSFSFVRKV